MSGLPSHIRISPTIAQAKSLELPIVALESTVITHGLPYPENLNLANELENEVRQLGVTPATIAVLNGIVHVGLNAVQLDGLATDKDLLKISSRDFASAITKKKSGGTTVAGSLVVAQLAGIQVFATGGIGGVHRHSQTDISADLQQLARTQLIVVCAGAKAILDLPATIEYLETHGVPVVGYQTNNFPAFYSQNSGLLTSVRADTPGEVIKIARAHWGFGLKTAILVTVPPPSDTAMPQESVKKAVDQALKDAQEKNIRGKDVTPFLLHRVSELTGGASLRANLGLLKNNARVAASIAKNIVRESPQSKHS